MIEVIFDPILEKLRVNDFDTQKELRLSKLEDNEQKIYYYEIITTTSGTINPPTGATLLQDEFGESGNALLAKVDANSKPIDDSPRDASNQVVTVSLDINTGQYLTSSAFVDSQVAIIYSFKIKSKDLGNVDINNIVGYEQLDYTAEEIKQKYESNPDTNPFTDVLKSKLESIRGSYTTVYVHSLSDLPTPVSGTYNLLPSTIYKLDSNIVLPNNTNINLPSTSFIVGDYNLFEISSNLSTPITGVDWKLRVIGILINGVPQGNGVFPSLSSTELIGLTTQSNGTTVWLEDLQIWATYKNGKWFDLTTGNEVEIVILKEDWESGSFSTNGWQVVNDTTNQWIVGQADPYTGLYSAYISNDGVNPTYTNNVPNISHIYKDIYVEPLNSGLTLEFMFKGVLELRYDYVRVYLAPTNVTPIAGNLLSNSYRVGNRQYNNSTIYQKKTITNLTGYGGWYRLIISFRNDGIVGGDSPRIDDLLITYKLP